jgi:hypothetical protein
MDALKATYGLSVSPKVQAILDQVNAQILRQRTQVSSAGR